MNLQRYLEQRNSLLIHEVALGFRTFTLFTSDQIEAGQIGYKLDPLGNSLTGTNPGDWRPEWLVIGVEDLNGDPVFVDLSSEEMPAYTATHGQGYWSPKLVASTFTGFVCALEEIDHLGRGRRNPVELQNNPITIEQRSNVLERIDRLTGSSLPDFWEGWIED